MHINDNGHDTKCLQVSLNLPGKENWPNDDHHNNGNLLSFVREPEDKQILADKMRRNPDSCAHPEDVGVA